MEALNLELAHKTVKNYVCSNCWGELEILFDLRENDMYFVTCKRCKDETNGYVTQYFANKERSNSEFAKRDVTRLLQNMGIIEKPARKSVNELKTELGY
jgi:DNA-directed RNA polymerase subunit RPC12/RpoP